MEQKTRVGSGKKVANYDLINISVCLTDIPKESINEYKGKEYINLTVAGRKEPDQYGKTHSVVINDYKPKEESAQTLVEKSDDLPF